MFNIKTIKAGDTFAIKIDNKNMLHNKYIILIKTEDFGEKYTSSSNYYLFRAKIIDSIDNLTFDKLNSAEYIKISLHLWEDRFYPFKGLETYAEAEKNRKTIFYPDEFEYLYSYIFEMKILKKYDLSEFIYLGNYNFDLPKEMLPSSPSIYMMKDQTNILNKKWEGKSTWKDFTSELIESYSNYNLKNHYFFTKEGIEVAKRRRKETIEVQTAVDCYKEQLKGKRKD